MASTKPTDALEVLIGLTPEQLKEQTTFHWGDKPSKFQLGQLFNLFHDYYNDTQLAAIIHEFTGLWAHSTNHLDLTRVAACAVEDYHYEYITGNQPNQKMTDYFKEARGMAVLRDVRKADPDRMLSDSDLDPFSEE